MVSRTEGVFVNAAPAFTKDAIKGRVVIPVFGEEGVGSIDTVFLGTCMLTMEVCHYFQFFFK